VPYLARGDMRFQLIEEKMNSAKFIQFLKRLQKDAWRPILVITDNARYHHSKETQRFIETQKDKIILEFIPAYSPELNPDEQVWNHLKLRLGKLSILNKEEMKKMCSLLCDLCKNRPI
jgi:transposase